MYNIRKIKEYHTIFTFDLIVVNKERQLIHIKGKDAKIRVSLERLKCNYYGNPRFKAYVSFIINGKEDPFDAVYTFTGSYLSTEEEAQQIALKHLEIFEKNFDKAPF